ncbi:MAG: sigma-54-dependent transcriptional regulator [Nitrospinaceae bacterium]
MEIRSILLVDDEKILLETVSDDLREEGFHVIAAGNGEEALGHLSPEWPGIVVTDIKMPRMDGLTLMRRIREIDAGLPVILITGQGDVPLAVEAMRAGAFDFIEKPCSPGMVLKIVQQALEKRRVVLHETGKASPREKAGPAFADQIIGASPVIKDLRKLIRNLSDSHADVLISGETGTGKELVARCLHYESQLRRGFFVPINCGAIPESIIESELFGHEAGAFTGAQKRRIGKFEYANQGTLFLDEIESTPLPLQVKLLRVLQEREVERLGSNESIPLDIRVVAATKIDLERAGSEGLFRQDLFYRLNVIHLHLPPLRDRREDIPLLFQFFVAQACSRYQYPFPRWAPKFEVDLMSREWPGNIRELKNEAERFVLGTRLEPSNLLQDPGGLATQSSYNGKGCALSGKVNLYERTVIEKELIRQKGNIQKTCASLGVPRQTLYDKLTKHGLKRTDYV